MSASARVRVASMLAAAAVLSGLTGCISDGTGWVPESVPAAGVQREVNGIRARNLLLVADEDGKAVLVGTLSSMANSTGTDTSNQLIGVTVAPEQEVNFQFGEPVEFPLQANVSQAQSLVLDGTPLEIPGLKLGRLARLNLMFADGTSISMDAPVMGKEHPDFKELWAQTYS